MEKTFDDKDDLQEHLADLCHSQWSGWMEYLFSKCLDIEDGSLIIPREFVSRWRRQVSTSFFLLSESEKDSDRKEADKFIELLNDLDIK